MAALDPVVECSEPINWMCCSAITGSMTQARLDLAAEAALSTLRALSGGVFDCVSRTIRPCGTTCHRQNVNTYTGSGRGARRGPWINGSGQWMNGGCGCGPGCGCCTPLSAIDLIDVEGLPVRGIVSVKVDGVVVDPASYRVDAAGGYQLVRTDGASFPCCSNVDLPDTEPGTFSVTYIAGRRLDAGGLLAYDTLACAVVSECVDPGSCGTLEGVANVLREGLSYSIENARDLFRDGLTGIESVDRWLRTVNPAGATQPTIIRSPDFRPHRTMIG